MSNGTVDSNSSIKEHLQEELITSNMSPRAKDPTLAASASALENGFHDIPIELESPFREIHTLSPTLTSDTFALHDEIVESANVVDSPMCNGLSTKAFSESANERTSSDCRSRRQQKLRILRLRSWLQQRHLERRIALARLKCFRIHSSITVQCSSAALGRAVSGLDSCQTENQLADLLCVKQLNSSNWLDGLLTDGIARTNPYAEVTHNSLTSQILRYHEDLDSDATDSDSEQSVLSFDGELPDIEFAQFGTDVSSSALRQPDPSVVWWRRRAELYAQCAWLLGRMDELNARLSFFKRVENACRSGRQLQLTKDNVCVNTEEYLSRCTPIPPNLTHSERSDLMQLTGTAHSLWLQSGGPRLRCSCHPPRGPCILCCGRINRVSMRRVDRRWITEPAAHPQLVSAPALAAHIVAAANKSCSRRRAANAQAAVTATALHKKQQIQLFQKKHFNTYSSSIVTHRRRKAQLQRRALCENNEEEEVAEGGVPPTNSQAIKRLTEKVPSNARLSVEERRNSNNSSRSSRSSSTVARNGGRSGTAASTAADDSATELDVCTLTSSHHFTNREIEQLPYTEISVPAWRLTSCESPPHKPILPLLSDSSINDVSCYTQATDGSLLLIRSLASHEDCHTEAYIRRHEPLELSEQRRNYAQPHTSAAPSSDKEVRSTPKLEPLQPPQHQQQQPVGTSPLEQVCWPPLKFPLVGTQLADFQAALSKQKSIF